MFDEEELPDFKDLMTQAEFEAKTEADLVKDNYPLACWVVKHHFASTGIEDQDLIQVALIGLLKAIRGFKPDRNIQFATYASKCITNEILMELRKVNRGLDRQATVVHLDDPNYNTEDAGCTIQEVVEKAVSPADSVSDVAERNEAIEAIYKHPLLREILVRDITQRELGNELGLSQSYISRLVKRALRELSGGKIVGDLRGFRAYQRQLGTSRRQRKATSPQSKSDERRANSKLPEVQKVPGLIGRQSIQEAKEGYTDSRRA